MKTTPLPLDRDKSTHRPLALTLALLGIAALSFGASSCSCCRTHYVADGTRVSFDLPKDYLSGKYRQLYRTDPTWFHVTTPSDPGAPGAPYPAYAK